MTLGQTIVPITSNWDFGGVGKWDWYASYWLAIGFWGVHDLSTANLRVHWLASPLSLGTPLQINNYRPKKSASSLKYWQIFSFFLRHWVFFQRELGVVLWIIVDITRHAVNLYSLKFKKREKNRNIVFFTFFWFAKIDLWKKWQFINYLNISQQF